MDLRGDPNKGGIGAALDEPGLYHFRVAAVNQHGTSDWTLLAWWQQYKV